MRVRCDALFGAGDVRGPSPADPVTVQCQQPKGHPGDHVSALLGANYQWGR